MRPDEYFGRFASQIAVVGRRGQARMRHARVHISGFGGLGNVLAFQLAASGVGHLSANDPQNLEIDNLGRFVCGRAADLGLPKVEAAAGFFRDRPGFRFVPVVAPNESRTVDPYYERANWIVSASNTVESRLACTAKALRCGKPLLDIAVADGRKSLAGTIKYKLPECVWAACPACYFEPVLNFERSEGLLLSVISVTAAMAAHILLQALAGKDRDALRRTNFCSVDLRPPFRIEMLAIGKRKNCPVCGQNGGGRDL